MAPQAKKPYFKQKWKIGESVLDVLIGGVSFLDTKDGFKGNFTDNDSAEKFLQGYGYDIIDPIELAELQGNMQEAIRFIKRYFLKPENPEGLALEVPKKLNDILDVRELLMLASSDDNIENRNWACAILRVVHTINHVDRDIRTHYFGEIQKQIFDRFYRHLHRDEGGQLYLGRSAEDPLRVDLVEFEVKPKKARDSTLMKLLHKPESVAEELFDRVGLRFITKSRVDSIRVIHFLEQTHSIVAANIKPSRSRNTLIDTKAFREVLKQDLEEEALEERLDEVPYPEGKAQDAKAGINQFTSQHYRAIQFTCRQLIKIRNSLADEIRELKHASKGIEISPAFQAVIDKMDPRQVQRVIRFFYPFEIQVMDELSFIENEKGRSAHREYKSAQQKAALLRVMGSLVNQ
jgi:uncharacterized protein (TIGR04562 family)